MPIALHRPTPSTTADLADAAGVTYRQLDYWLRSGLLGPELADGAQGSGSRRTFTAGDVGRILLVALLRRAGVALDHHRPAIIDALDRWDDAGQPRAGYLVLDDRGARLELTLDGTLPGPAVIVPLEHVPRYRPAAEVAAAH